MKEMTEELNKLEAAIREIKIRFMYSSDPDDASQVCWFMDTVDADNFGLIMNAARAHLAAQRQAPSDRAAALDALAWLNGASAKYEYDNFLRHPDVFKHLETIRAALTNSVPVEVVLKLREILQTARKEFNGAELDLSNYGHGDICAINNCYDGLLQLIYEALRELELWVKGVK